MAPRRGSWLKRLGGGLLVAVILLLCVEAGLRVAYGPPPPAVAVFTAVGEQDHYFKLVDGQVTAPYQFKDPVRPFPSVTRAPRVAFLGGSSVHGGVQGLLSDKEFPGLVGQLTGIETLNLATPSLDSHDTVRIVEELMAWPFTAIVVYDGHNDFGNVFFNSRYVGVTAGLQAHLQAGLEHFQLYSLLRRSLRPTTASPGVHKGRAEPGKTEGVSAARREVARREFEANLRRIAWITHQHGVKLILGTPASCLQTGPSGRECIEEPCANDLWQAANRANDVPGGNAAEVGRLLGEARDVDPIPLRAPSSAIETVRRVAADEGALLVDPVADLPRDTQRDIPDCRLFQDNVHFNEEGHRAMAALFAPVVEEAVKGAK
jgi:hypothetical protein